MLDQAWKHIPILSALESHEFRVNLGYLMSSQNSLGYTIRKEKNNDKLHILDSHIKY
ncbi:mCG148350 [Mus musculus]|nr:mCG148350 [Mus musculus]